MEPYIRQLIPVLTTVVEQISSSENHTLSSEFINKSLEDMFSVVSPLTDVDREKTKYYAELVKNVNSRLSTYIPTIETPNADDIVRNISKMVVEEIDNVSQDSQKEQHLVGIRELAETGNRTIEFENGPQKIFPTFCSGCNQKIEHPVHHALSQTLKMVDHYSKCPTCCPDNKSLESILDQVLQTMSLEDTNAPSNQ